MATVSYTATCGELLALSKGIRDAVAGLPEKRKYTISLDHAAGGNSTWGVTNPAGKVGKG